MEVNASIPSKSKKTPNLFEDFREGLHIAPPMRFLHRSVGFEPTPLWGMSQTLTNRAHPHRKLSYS